MTSLSGIGLGLSLVFGCLFLALLLEVYYMLCWKKRFVCPRKQQEEIVDDDEDKLSGSSSARELMCMFCCKKVSSLSNCAALNPHQICASIRTQQQKKQSSNIKDNVVLESEDGFLSQPRYLFTIMEETMEDLESDNDECKPAKNKKGSTSLHELLQLTHTPYLTPLSSPQFINHDYSCSISQSPHHGFNPFLESSSDFEFSRIKASPPPKFMFLQAAEEKFKRRRMAEKEQVDIRNSKAPTFSQDSFITIVIGDHSNDRAQ